MSIDLELELKDALEQQAATELAGREHPELEQLVAYHDGALDREQEEALQGHLAWCGECTALVLGLNDLALAAAAADPAAEWSSVVSKLPAPPAPPRAAPLPARRRQHDKATRRLLYALAASFAAATVALSLWVVDLRREVTGFSEPQINPIVRDLFIADAPRDVTGTGFNEIPAGDGLVTLILNSSEPRSFPGYQLAVEDSAGTEIWRREGLERSPFDTFTVAVPGRFLPAGDYRLRLYGREGDSWTPIEEFPLRVR